MTAETKKVEEQRQPVETETFERVVLIDSEKIAERVKELGQKITEDYKGQKLLMIGILKGATIFTADLIRQIDPNIVDVELDFMAVSSYNGEQSSREPRILKDLDKPVSGTNLLLVEDIVDTGYSFETLLKILSSRNPASLKTCALISKPERREVDVPINYLGFEIPDKWIEGYGMDTDEKYRGLPDIVYRQAKPSNTPA